MQAIVNDTKPFQLHAVPAVEKETAAEVSDAEEQVINLVSTNVVGSTLKQPSYEKEMHLVPAL